MPPFPHLTLVQRRKGRAKLNGRGNESHRTVANKANRVPHRDQLRLSAIAATNAAKIDRAARPEEAPNLPAQVPLLLQIDPGFDDIDKLRELFNFEIVSEQENGFIIVAAQDIQLSTFLQKIDDFAGKVRGATAVASVHQLHADEQRQLRLEQVLSEQMLASWGLIADNEMYTCDLGISCVGMIEIPRVPKKRMRESDQEWAHRHNQWTEERERAYEAWDDLMCSRAEEISNIVAPYQGEVTGIFHDNVPGAAVPDSFTVRVTVNGRGLRDIVLNYPFLFEVVEPDDVMTPQRLRQQLEDASSQVELLSPAEDAPAVCVIDSGIQEGHYLLEPAMDTATSRCFIPGREATEIADYVSPGGHGTRVAGAVLYPDSIPTEGTVQLSVWLQNARILNEFNQLSLDLFPPAVLNEIVTAYHEGARRTRIFNHSVATIGPCRTRHMSAWAAEIDLLSLKYDVLVIQSAGNLFCNSVAPQPGVVQHLAAGRAYPHYLNEASCRIANPAQSLQALTVGSVAYGRFAAGGWTSLASERGHPSAFSRSGLGIWSTIKPEVVEFGGDDLATAAVPPDVSTPDVGRDCYPELVRSTMLAPGPAFDRDTVGTSFSAPKVAGIAARIQAILPEESCLLYRALIVQSARWPEWAMNASAQEKASIIRWIGFGVPDLQRATVNTDHRVTLISAGEREIKARECHIFQVPIPAEMRNPADDFDVLVEVTLSYVASPRRTRRGIRHYLSTWVDWKSSRIGESRTAFTERVMKMDDPVGPGEGSPFGWTLETFTDAGVIRGVRRNLGTVQKDWAVVKSNALPEDFCVAVVGHPGWSKDPDSTAKYAVVVSFEVLGQQIPIYSQIQTSVEELQAEVEAEVEAQVDVEEVEVV